MKIFALLALRNLRRQSRRTIVSLAMIVGGYCAVVMFNGFFADILYHMENSAVDTMYGHLQVAKPDFFSRKPVPVRRDVFVQDEPAVVDSLQKIKGVQSVSGRVSLFALLSDGELTVSVQGIGFDIKQEPMMVKNLFFFDGAGLDELSDREIIIGIGLNKAIHAKPGDRLSLVTSTLDGTVNGMDVTVKGIFAIGTTEVDDYVVFMPLSAAKKLIDADSAEQLVLHLDKEDDLTRISKDVANAIKPFGLELKNWRDLAFLFTQVETFFDQQRVIFLVILGVIILLGIANSVSMAIVERTSEIGTLRALGFEKRDLLGIFLLESIFLGLIGIAISVPLSALLIVGISAQEIPILLPATSTSFPLALRFTQHGYVQGAMIAIWAPLLATLPTMIRILKVPIVDALKQK